ncbi:MAG: HEAT repeat domain-containing protein, partial [Chthoniobacteraceae bacterium]
MRPFPFLAASIVAIVAPAAFVAPASAQQATHLELKKGDNIAIVGSGLADRQQHQGWLESLIHKAYPDLDLTVRNLGFAADEVNVHPRSDEVPTTEDFLNIKPGTTQGNLSPSDNRRAKNAGSDVIYHWGADFHASVILAYWGFNESFKGEAGLADFRKALDEYLKHLAAADYGKGKPRVVLLSPIANENVKDPTDYPDGSANNKNLAVYTRAMAEVAKTNGVQFVDLFSASQELYAKAARPLTINGIHLSDEGDKQLAPAQFKAIFGKDAPSTTDPAVEKIRAAVLDKNAQWHHRYRTVDQYNIYGGRSRIKYEGVDNATIMGEEMADRDIKVANRDKAVWAAAQGRSYVVDDSDLKPVDKVPPNRPVPVPYMDGAEAVQHIKVPEGCKVEFIASEKEFPELINPVQMNFDTRGRLWVSAWPTYPESTPTDKNMDKLLVFDIDPKTGKFAKCTTFADGLNCPTGFQLYKDGVIVMQSPDMWFLRDTSGKGLKADWKERIVTGLDAADSHHETNSICYEPGGAVYFSDGVFHRTNVETLNGPIRNQNGCIYRFEPRTSKFERYVPYGFANPHGRVFDYWGNDIITDATGNASYFAPAFSGHLDSGAHPGMQQFWQRPSRPTPGTNILSSRHFPDDWQGQFLNTNVISFQGIFRAKVTEEGSGLHGETIEPLVDGDIKANPNFRPSGIAVAPDGSLYFMDWSQMLIGHLQHHLRDPNRDHQHGRIYRITFPSRPLLTPKKIHGEPIANLLELLKEHEDNVRQRAKIELDTHDTKEVIAAVDKWEKALDKKDKDYEHNRIEALWVHQWHNVVNTALLNDVLKSPEPRARAQAVRVLCYWRDRVPNALALLKTAAEDESPRVRLEAVRAASFFNGKDVPAAMDVAYTILKRDTDYYLDYCYNETLKQLRSIGGDSVLPSDPAIVAKMIEKMSDSELARAPGGERVYMARLERKGTDAGVRDKAINELAKLHKTDRVTEIISVLGKLDAKGGSASAGAQELAKALDKKDKDYEHNRLEALWVHQWHNVVNTALLNDVLKSPEPRARA